MEALRSLATPPQLPPPRLTLPELRRTVSHEGDLLRLQCVLQRLRNGENVTIGVIGGSISAGTSVRVRANQSGLFHKQATEWLQSAYPAAKIVHFNAAMPAMATPTGQGRCGVRLTVLDETSSGEHKFKLTALFLNQLGGKDMFGGWTAKNALFSKEEAAKRDAKEAGRSTG